MFPFPFPFPLLFPLLLFLCFPSTALDWYQLVLDLPYAGFTARKEREEKVVLVN